MTTTLIRIEEIASQTILLSELIAISEIDAELVLDQLKAL